MFAAYRRGIIGAEPEKPEKREQRFLFGKTTVYIVIAIGLLILWLGRGVVAG